MLSLLDDPTVVHFRSFAGPFPQIKTGQGEDLQTIDDLAKGHPARVPETTDKARITANGMRSLRRRLRVTGQDFARLLGITPQVVYGWEKASGPLRMRGTTRAAMLAVRGIGAREARRRLEEMKGTKKPGKTAPGRRRRVPKGAT